MDDITKAKCPFSSGHRNRDWWPDQLDIQVLHRNSPSADPMGKAFDYAKEFKSLDLDAVIKDLHALMTDSQEWWPADFRSLRRADDPDGVAQRGHLPHRRACRGGAGAGQQRFAPLNSWPDNANLDKARRLLWPISRSTAGNIRADLMILAGNVALDPMGFKTFGRRRPRRCLGARKSCSGDPRGPGSATNATAANANSRTRSRGAGGPDLRQSGRAQRQAGSVAAAKATSVKRSSAWR
jgi:catalase (peroxidase I)